MSDHESSREATVAVRLGHSRLSSSVPGRLGRVVASAYEVLNMIETSATLTGDEASKILAEHICKKLGLKGDFNVNVQWACGNGVLQEVKVTLKPEDK